MEWKYRQFPSPHRGTCGKQPRPEQVVPVGKSLISSRFQGRQNRRGQLGPVTLRNLIIKAATADAATPDALVTDAVETHLGHHYFASSCLSPLINRRTDEFRGSLQNRAKVAAIQFTTAVSSRRIGLADTTCYINTGSDAGAILVSQKNGALRNVNPLCRSAICCARCSGV